MYYLKELFKKLFMLVFSNINCGWTGNLDHRRMLLSILVVRPQMVGL